MKDIKAILTEYELPADQVEKIAAEVMQNYRSLAELTKKEDRIKELEAQNNELQTQVEKLDSSSEEIENLKKAVEQYKTEEEERKKAESEKAARDSFEVVFNATLGEKEFANDLMRETIFEKVYKLCEENSGLGAKEALDSVTKDVPGVWVNPQRSAAKMPGAGEIDSKTPDSKAAKRAFVREFFGSGTEK